MGDCPEISAQCFADGFQDDTGLHVSEHSQNQFSPALAVSKLFAYFLPGRFFSVCDLLFSRAP